jgi:multiple sugar transport system substrate-binding protein
MKTRYWYATFVLAMIAALLLSSCARPTATPAPEPTQPPAAEEEPPKEKPAEEEPTEEEPAEESAEPVKIRSTVWMGEAELEALGKLTEVYLEANPNVEIEWINISGGGPWGRDKLQTMIAGGDAPDVMMLNTGQFEGFASRGALLPLDDFVSAEGFDLSIYWPQGIDGSSYQGKLYALPRDMSNVILYYNKDLFDAAGVEYPTDDWDWNDLLAAAQELTIDKDGDGQIDQWGFAVNNTVWVWVGFVWANGGRALSVDRRECLLEEPEAVEALKFYFDLQTEHGVSPPPGALPEQGWAGDWMLTQSTAMGLFGPWFRPSMVGNENQFRWDVAYPPKSPNTGNRGSVVYTDQWSIYSGSEVAEDAWDFIKFLTSKQSQEMWTELIGARSISPVKEVAETDAWLHYGDSTGEIILDSLSFSWAPPVNFGNANEAENIWDQEFGLVIAGEATVEEAVASICEQIGPVLLESD